MRAVVEWRCDAMRCDAMRCDAMRCDAMRCDAMRCDAMRCDAMRCDRRTGRDGTGRDERAGLPLQSCRGRPSTIARACVSHTLLHILTLHTPHPTPRTPQVQSYRAAVCAAPGQVPRRDLCKGRRRAGAGRGAGQGCALLSHLSLLPRRRARGEDRGGRRECWDLAP